MFYRFVVHRPRAQSETVATQFLTRGVQTLPTTPKRKDENYDDDTMAPLNELAEIRARLEEKAKHRASYKGALNAIDHQKPLKSPTEPKSRFPQVRARSTEPEHCVETEDVSTTTWQFSGQPFSPRSVISVNGHNTGDDGLLRVRTDLGSDLLNRSNQRVQTSTYENTVTTQQHHGMQYIPAVLVPVGTAMLNPREMMGKYASLPALNDYDTMDRHRTQISIQDENARKPQKSIMKARRSDFTDDASTTSRRSSVARAIPVLMRNNGANESAQSKSDKQAVTEEQTRTEEVERTVRHHRKKKDKQRQQSARREWQVYPAYYQSSGGNRGGSSTMGRQDESWWRQQHTRRIRDSSYDNRNVADSLRRGELRYDPNGDIRRTGSRMHKSYSNRDIYNTYDGSSVGPASYRSAASRHGHTPIVEFPPTLPRHGMDAPAPPPHRYSNNNAQLMKSRSMHDWEGGQMQVHRDGHDRSALQRDFEQSLLMPMPAPGQRVDEREYRNEPLPGGGHESFAREVKGDSGRRYDPEGRMTDFSEAKQEMHYTRESVR